MAYSKTKVIPRVVVSKKPTPKKVVKKTAVKNKSKK